ncbi:lysophosphatidic acid receptor 5 [Tupaia chinensis]|uniref:lysophosphatidic acid receptor 5 n=1 Tax=Tupaia chinensis TaxID=246437 RepID=UPI0003C8C657|nr:lysophosphatidic acid receptor 5 [Tupaia chinensis]
MLANSTANTSPGNGSVPPCPDYRATHLLHLVVYSLVLAAGLPLNALALWVFLRALRIHSVVSVYMCNLAASDLLFTLSLPVRLSYYALHYWPFPDLLCQTAGAIFQMNMYGSCIFLTLINVDRYIAIVHPLRLRHLRRPYVARLLCLGVWGLILVFAVPAAHVHRPSPCSYRDLEVRLCFESFSDELWKGRLLPLVLLAEGLGFLLPLVAVVYSSARVFWTLARPDSTRSQRRRKTVRLLLANLVIFLLCFVPYNATLAVYGLLRGHLAEASTTAPDQARQGLMADVHPTDQGVGGRVQEGASNGERAREEAAGEAGARQARVGLGEGPEGGERRRDSAAREGGGRRGDRRRRSLDVWNGLGFGPQPLVPLCSPSPPTREVGALDLPASPLP